MPGTARARGWLLAAMGSLLLGCSPTAGPMRPEPGVGRPVDPTTLPEPPEAAAPAVQPPPAEREPPTRLPGNVSRDGAASVAAPITDVQRLPDAARGRTVRVLIGAPARETAFAASSSWRIERPGDAVAVASGAAGRTWTIERNGEMLRVVRGDGTATPFRRGVLTLRPSDRNAVIVVAGVRYRGTLVFHATDAGIQVVNHLPLEDYVAGVVPLEIGRARTTAELAAVEAQAVAARSYTLTRLGGAGRFDLRATTADQVYGGVDAETPVAIRAVLNTRGLVLRYGGRTVNAPYHSTCGGTTAAAQEVWRTGGEPFLQRVSDRIPGTDRDYCEISPRYRWQKTIDAATLDAAVARHLRDYHRPPPGGFGRVRSVRVEGTTGSGRAADVIFTTARGQFTLRGNDARSVLRRPGGEILNSSYFSVRGPAEDGGGVALEGRGYGHGVGMCQWGAIGRARAGQDFRTILRTYFPGTTVEPAR